MAPIMLATDGSASAQAATDEAIELAKSLDAPLVVTCVERETIPMRGYYGYGEITAELKRNQLKRIAEVSTAVMEQAEAEGVPCESLVLSGVPGEQICKAASGRGALMIVLGAHGWGRLGRLIHGTVSTYVVHHASVPVLVVQGARSL